MARKRTPLPRGVEAEIAARTARGESAATIKHAVPGAPSIPTIERRQRELRGGRPGSRGPEAKSTPTPATRTVTPTDSTSDVPETIPDGASLEELDRWISRCDEGARKAEEQGHLQAMASLAARAATLMTLRRKSTPLPAPDPSTNPDYRALAALGRERLRKLAHDLFTGNDVR